MLRGKAGCLGGVLVVWGDGSWQGPCWGSLVRSLVLGASWARGSRKELGAVGLGQGEAEGGVLDTCVSLSEPPLCSDVRGWMRCPAQLGWSLWVWG